MYETLEQAFRVLVAKPTGTHLMFPVDDCEGYVELRVTERQAHWRFCREDYDKHSHLIENSGISFAVEGAA